MRYTIGFVLRGDVRITVTKDVSREEFITSEISIAVQEDKMIFCEADGNTIMIRGGEIMAVEIVNPDNE